MVHKIMTSLKQFRRVFEAQKLGRQFFGLINMGIYIINIWIKMEILIVE
ncbi:unnamed protein product [Paramecium sonneborni]|uniref:Uncharacterized protein n=1 Tax=Paramecium sonneborni TaxID=65129 RepID=A0A8S1PG22_9CILI|nr:unnamed protein product [Paramecium sonneborni]